MKVLKGFTNSSSTVIELVDDWKTRKTVVDWIRKQHAPQNASWIWIPSDLFCHEQIHIYVGEKFLRQAAMFCQISFWSRRQVKVFSADLYKY